MPISEDYVREERIKRVRRQLKAGEQHLLTLHDAVKRYLRLTSGDESIFRIRAAIDTTFTVEPRKDPRDWKIAVGMFMDQRLHGRFSKISQWFVESSNLAIRDLSDDLLQEFRCLGEPISLDVGHAGMTAEQQLSQVSVDIENRVALFAAQLKRDGEYEDVAPALRDAAGGWPHLRELLADSVLDGYLARMRKRRTRSDISGAIGAAKEVTEATMKALAEGHNAVPASSKPDLQDWWKALRPHLADAKVDAALGAKDGALQKLISGEVSTLQALGELRNKVGTGHGKTDHPSGLTAGHALLAVDTAHTLTRFLAT